MLKKLIVCITISLILLLPMTKKVLAQTIKAIDLTKSNIVTISDGQNGNCLCDDNFSTNLNLKKGATVTIQNEVAFSGIYIVWSKPIGKYELTTNTAKYTLGENSFMHEFKKLNSSENSVTINIPDDAFLCDVYTFTDGVLPDWVQDWQKPYEDADMLLFPTHAADETIYFGGTIPYYAGEKGLKVQVCYMVSHDSEVYRINEALNACWAMGLKAYPVFGDVPDAYITTLEKAKIAYDYDELVKSKVENIRRFKPEIVIGMDLQGEYGHGGHMIDALSVLDAVDKSNDASQYPASYNKYGGWNVSKTYLHLNNDNNIKMNWDQTLGAFNNKTAFDVAQNGLEQYTSQLHDFSQLKKSGVYDCTSFGLVRSIVGKDVQKNDFTENVVFKEDNQQVMSQDSGDSASGSVDNQYVSIKFETDKAKTLSAVISSGIFLILMIATILWKKSIKDD